jgi:hypothetical protein
MGTGPGRYRDAVRTASSASRAARSIVASDSKSEGGLNRYDVCSTLPDSKMLSQAEGCRIAQRRTRRFISGDGFHRRIGVVVGNNKMLAASGGLELLTRPERTRVEERN